ncbi:interferon-induced protein with tetratricopeptide repeats 8 isoform X1 [Oncorhynchus mykiss]|uniref:interferon-induced protein with tetratricopeptide repeats 8 isoform X1 n=1 Tax=Oncorhynchus mykiss TaxID=8022 RepID=UPI000B4F02DC|nr:interferon-induced protein with tetratricopeptide repeats 8 isoform X1 [Oncorhynchus mykiss]
MSDSENTLEKNLKKLQCHFTWELNKEQADLNLLEIKLRETLEVVQEGFEGNLKRHSLNLLAYIKHLKGEDKRALECLEKAERENAHGERLCVVTYGNLAWVCHHIGDDIRADGYIQKLEEIHKASATASTSVLLVPREVHSEKAWSLLKFSKHHYTRAKECFQEALQMEPEDKEWNSGFAFSLFRQEGLVTREDQRLSYEDSLAVKQLNYVLELNPDSAMTRVYLGLKCYKNRRNAEAWGYMRKALSLAPYDLSVVLQVGRFMKKEQSYDEALAVLLRMLQRAPNSSRLHHEIANNYRWRAKQSGDPHDQTLLKRCVFHLEEGARLNPTHIYPQVELAVRYSELKDTSKAMEKFQELWSRSDLKPSDRQAWHRMYGDVQLYHLGSERTAVNHYKEGMRLYNISTEWSQCRRRLLKVLRFNKERRGDDPYDIREFVDSFKRGVFNVEDAGVSTLTLGHP